jgi:hypothetical protein
MKKGKHQNCLFHDSMHLMASRETGLWLWINWYK